MQQINPHLRRSVLKHIDQKFYGDAEIFERNPQFLLFSILLISEIFDKCISARNAIFYENLFVDMSF